MKKSKTKEPFNLKHPKLNVILGVLFFAIIVILCFALGYFVFVGIKKGIEYTVSYLKEFVSSTDKVIVVAMITGSVSVFSVVFSSVIAKVIDYRFNVKKYLYDKREEPYEKFIDMVYTIMEDTKKEKNERMTESDIVKMVSEFSRGLTLWGSKGVVKKWLKYRKASIEKPSSEILLMLEDIIYEIRKDVGQRGKLKRGTMLSFFINDVEDLMRKVKNN